MDSTQRYLLKAESISRCASSAWTVAKRRAVPMWTARRSVGVGVRVWDSGVETDGSRAGGS